MPLFNSPAWQLILQSDMMSKFILLVLFLMSVLCVTIVIFKFATSRNQKILLNSLTEKMNRVKKFDELITIGKEYQKCIGGRFLIQNLSELKMILEKNQAQKIFIQDLEHLDLVANQTIDQLILENEIYLPILGTSSAVSPLMGLFGTVWGLIHSFVNISQEKSADISVVAPGIAETLTTTLAGLIVAIPAMIAFHYFSNELRKQEQQLIHLSERYLNIIKHTFLQ